MRRLTLFIIALAMMLPTLAQAYDVLLLQSRRDPGYEEVLKGFTFDQNHTLRKLVLADYAEVDVVRIVREERPRLILVVGDAALAATRTIRNIPIVSVMALGIHTQKASQPNLTGVGMSTEPDQYISTFQTMKARRIGVIYNPAKSAWYLHLARKAAEEAGIQLVTREVSAPRETIGQLATLADKVDALWMLPDSTAVTKESIEAYFHFGQQHAVPVVSFAPNYLGLGAAAIVELDRVYIGRQADAMISQLLRGSAIANFPVIFPKGSTVKTNPSVLKHLSTPQF